MCVFASDKYSCCAGEATHHRPNRCPDSQETFQFSKTFSCHASEAICGEQGPYRIFELALAKFYSQTFFTLNKYFLQLPSLTNLIQSIRQIFVFS